MGSDMARPLLIFARPFLINICLFFMPFSYQHLPLLYTLFLFAYVHCSAHYTALPLTLYIARHKQLVRSVIAYRMYRDMFFYRQLVAP